MVLGFMGSGLGYRGFRFRLCLGIVFWLLFWGHGFSGFRVRVLGFRGSWLRFRSLCLVLGIWFGFVSLVLV